MKSECNLVPPSVVAAYELKGATFSPIEIGWINRTLRVARGGELFILQRLHPVFGAAVHKDIEAITRHLQARGLNTPLLLPTVNGMLWHEEGEEVWRMLDHLSGQTHHKLDTRVRASSAGKLAAQFHRALSDLDHVFAFKRDGVHDTALHLRKLQGCLEEYGASIEHEQNCRQAGQVLEAAASLPTMVLERLPQRIVHGDLKATNILFDESDRAVALIDLDTLSHGTIAMELGDALRSWCNTSAESDAASSFDAEIFEAAMGGYAEGAEGLLGRAEVQSIVGGAETICVELAARFAVDLFEDRYFGWDKHRFASRREHNRARVNAQLNLGRSICAQRSQLQDILGTLFG